MHVDTGYIVTELIPVNAGATYLKRHSHWLPPHLVDPDIDNYNMADRLAQVSGHITNTYGRGLLAGEVAIITGEHCLEGFTVHFAAWHSWTSS